MTYNFPIIPARNINKYNEEWSRFTKLGCPWFCITKKIKYAQIYYDFYNTNYLLNEKSVEEITEIWENFEKMNPDAFKNESYYAGFDEIDGYVVDIEFSKAKILADKMVKIVFNSNNWVIRPVIKEILEEYPDQAKIIL